MDSTPNETRGFQNLKIPQQVRDFFVLPTGAQKTRGLVLVSGRNWSQRHGGVWNLPSQTANAWTWLFEVLTPPGSFKKNQRGSLPLEKFCVPKWKESSFSSHHLDFLGASC